MSQYFEKSRYLEGKFAKYLIIDLSILLVAGAVVILPGMTIKSLEEFKTWAIRSLLIIIAAYFLHKVFNRKTDAYAGGIGGENLIARKLKSLPEEYSVFHGLSLQPRSDIDFVVVGPTGVFAIEVKRRSGLWNMDMRRFLRQANYSATILKEFIQQRCGQKLWVDAILVFSKSRAYVDPGVHDRVRVVTEQDLDYSILSRSPINYNYDKIIEELKKA